MDAIQEIILSGNAYERGFQHGQQLGREINEFLADNRARINTIREFPLEEEVIQSLVQQHAVVIEEQVPDIATELQGLAAGAGISYEDAVLLQIRVELIAHKNTDILEGDCSTLAIRDSKNCITGQTIDLAGDLTSLGRIFRIIPEDSTSPTILMYGFAGLLGYMGLNDLGLSININMIVSDDWKPGVSPYLLVRHLLNFSSIDECVMELQRIRQSSSRSFLLTDQTRIANLEFTGNEMRIIEGNSLLHTNHFLHTELAQTDKIHFLFKNSSVKRLKLLEQLLMQNIEPLTPGILFGIFSDHSLYPVGLCAHGEGNIRRSETVAAVVMEPAKFTMYARKGNPCQSQTQLFSLKQELTADYS